MDRLLLLKLHLPFLLVLLMTGVIVACGGSEEATEEPAAAAPTAAPTAAAAPTEAPAAEEQATSAPAPSTSGAPESVGKLTVAADAWGSDLLNSWEDTQPSFLRDYFSTRLLARDENMVVSPLWASTWSQDANGILLTLHPDAACQNGEPMDAEALMINLEGILGNIEGFSGSFLAASLDDLIDTSGYDIRGDREIFLGTDSPSPAGWAILHGANYHTIWFNPPDYLQEVGHEEYVRNPVGCGPYELTEFNPGDSATFVRWDDFWGDYDYYSPPQHETLELVKVPEATTRFAQLTAGNVDMALGLPYPIAKDLERSENGSQGAGFNPGTGSLWTQTLGANGKMQVAFDLEFALKELKDDGSPKADPATWGDDPTLNLRVREALAMAVDKKSIQDTGFGFLLPNQSICSKGSFGWRESQDFVSEYNPERAKQILEEEGFGDGFELQAHFGEFAGRPNQKEAMDIIASNWNDLGIKLSVNEHDPFTYYSSGDAGNREYQSVNEWSWGRQEHCAVLVNLAYSSSGFRNEYNEETDMLNEELKNTVDESRQLEIMARVDDVALENHWIIPLYDASAVYGYTDRVLEHKQPPFGAHFMDLQRILLRD
jgi:peptide/nickel transport system substrate-binding protein